MSYKSLNIKFLLANKLSKIFKEVKRYKEIQVTNKYIHCFITKNIFSTTPIV